MKEDDLKARIEELEADLQARDGRIKELKAEQREAHDLVDQMREQVEDSNTMVESWIEAFDMVEDEDGMWTWGPGIKALHDNHARLQDQHQKLLRKWNKLVGDYNSTVAPRERGRPLEASDAQVKAVKH